MSEKAQQLIRDYLPGPLTVVLPRKQGAPPLWLTVSGGGKDPMIGVRMSSHPFAQELVSAFGGPIATTSANMHGLPSPYAAHEILEQWKDADSTACLLIDHGALPRAQPSTVIAVRGSHITVLRQGALHVV